VEYKKAVLKVIYRIVTFTKTMQPLQSLFSPRMGYHDSLLSPDKAGSQLDPSFYQHNHSSIHCAKHVTYRIEFNP
jgi:hypothetical protein